MQLCVTFMGKKKVVLVRAELSVLGKLSGDSWGWKWGQSEGNSEDLSLLTQWHSSQC